MPDSNKSSFVPHLIEEWVHRNPFPIVVLEEGLKILVSNDSYGKFLKQSSLNTADLMEQLLPGESEPVSVLTDNQCLLKRLDLSDGDHHYVSHVVKLTLDGTPCLCCILLPDSDPSQTYLQGILNTITCYVVECDSRGNVRYLNDQLLEHLGYDTVDRPALIHLQQLLRNFRQDRWQLRIGEVGRHDVSHFRTKLVTKENKEITAEASLVQNQTPGESGYLLTARDISHQLAHEADMNQQLNAAHLEKESLKLENTRLQVVAMRTAAENGLVYRSDAFAKVMDQIQQVAPTDVTVLITGETGTGKELIAQTIHRLSERRSKAFITVDCASLPPTLIESELFGYRKGAFTGAYRDRVGRFAAADGGTILLDEIGELPLLLQTRLLRVLEKGEFTPVGETTAQRTDVRVIAATNRDLKGQVAAGKFRADLYYRLNVFPVHSIPLRDRKEDIALLVVHFINRYNEKFNKALAGPDATTLDRLRAYSFPGNIRELENMVERAFIISGESRLHITVPPNERSESIPVLDVVDGQLTEFMSFEAYQRKYIELVLESTGGKVSGPGGAAEILQLHPQTLFSKIRKLGIRR